MAYARGILCRCSVCTFKLELGFLHNKSFVRKKLKTSELLKQQSIARTAIEECQEEAFPLLQRKSSHRAARLPKSRKMGQKSYDLQFKFAAGSFESRCDSRWTGQGVSEAGTESSDADDGDVAEIDKIRQSFGGWCDEGC